jgi:hypothetical protein
VDDFHRVDLGEPLAAIGALARPHCRTSRPGLRTLGQTEQVLGQEGVAGQARRSAHTDSRRGSSRHARESTGVHRVAQCGETLAPRLYGWGVPEGPNPSGVRGRGSPSGQARVSCVGIRRSSELLAVVSGRSPTSPSSPTSGARGRRSVGSGGATAVRDIRCA